MRRESVIILLALFALICGALIMQTISIYAGLTKHIDRLAVYSLDIDPYTDMEARQKK